MPQVEILNFKTTKYTNHVFDFQTPFVRQNTPHPKELKAKAGKLFTRTPEQQTTQEKPNEAPTANGVISSSEPVQIRIAEVPEVRFSYYTFAFKSYQVNLSTQSKIIIVTGHRI